MSSIMGDSLMLTQYDTAILAGLPMREVAAEPRTGFDAVKCVSAEDHADEEARRPSRLDILLEPVGQAGISVRTLLSTVVRRERSAFSVSSQNRTT